LRQGRSVDSSSQKHSVIEGGFLCKKEWWR
jgi:hypothetical protein